MRHTKRWEMPEVTFYQVEGHGFEAHLDRVLYAYGNPGETDSQGMPKTGELYATLDRALVAWVAEKYTGRRGAGGTGVGTAADWFMRMIGADQLVEAGPEGGRALVEAVNNNRDKGLPLAANRIEHELEARGFILARQKHS